MLRPPQGLDKIEIGQYTPTAELNLGLLLYAINSVKARKCE